MRASIGILLAAALHCAAQPQPASDASGIKLTSVRLARTAVPGVLDMRATVQTEADFLTTDPCAWYLMIYNGGHKGDEGPRGVAQSAR